VCRVLQNVPERSFVKNLKNNTLIIIILIIIIIIAVEVSLGSSSPYTSTDKTIKNKYTQKKQYNCSTNKTQYSTSTHISKTLIRQYV